MLRATTAGLALGLGLMPVMPVAVGQPADEKVHVVLPRDAIPAISNPEFEPAQKARGLGRNELVLGIVGEREARAYSTWQLDRREIVNDTFEGKPIAVTW